MRSILITISILACCAMNGQEKYWKPVFPEKPYLRFSQGWRIPGTNEWVMKCGSSYGSVVKGNPDVGIWRQLDLPVGTSTSTSSSSYKTVRDIHFFNSNEFLILRSYTPLLHTSDGGKTFKEVGGAPAANAKNMVFINPSTGFLIGSQVLMRTEDGGKNWKDIYPSIAYDTTISEGWMAQVGDDIKFKPDTIITKLNTRIRKLKFVNDTLGYIYLDRSREYRKSTNGGKTWRKVTDQFEAQNAATLMGQVSYYGTSKEDYDDFRKIQSRFSKKSYGTANSLYKQNVMGIVHVDGVFYACGYKGLFMRSTDGGKSWQRKPAESTENYYFLKKTGKDKLIMGGYRGALYEYNLTDGTFNALGKVPTTKTIKDVYFKDKNTGWCADYYGNVYGTTNGGYGWKKVGFVRGRKSYSFSALQFVEKNGGVTLIGLQRYSSTCYAYEVEIKEGYGFSQKEHTISGMKYAYGLYPTPNGYLVASSSTMFWMDKDFKDAREVASTRLKNVKVYDDGFGLAVGYGGVVMHTRDGGKTWKSEPNVVTSQYLNDVAFDGKNAVAVGYYGTVIQKEF